MQKLQSINQDETGIAKEFRDYVYGVSHDVGAPVRAMVEFSKILVNEHGEKLDEEGKYYLSLIRASGERLQNMLAGLLDYSRLNTEAQPFAPVDCNQVLKNALITLDDIIQNKQAHIDYQPLPVIDGDATQIWQLFVALLDNALKFQFPHTQPHITIKAEDYTDFWEFSVRDNGIGIEERFHKKIFHVFQRLNPDEDYPGVGIGLTLAQKIAHRHGGNIWVEPRSEMGAVFCFTLPKSAKK